MGAFLTTVVEKSKSIRKAEGDERGQSVLEFLLVLPLLFGITSLLVRVNTVIQMSIVDQKYARQQLLFVSGNGADYPRRAGMVNDMMYAYPGNVLTVGVSENYTPENDPAHRTLASTYSISRKSDPPGADNSDQMEVQKRSNIRVRNTVSICIPLVSFGGRPALSPGDSGIPQYQLPEDPTQWTYCNTRQDFEG